MEPRDYATAVRKFWALILLLALAGAGAGFYLAQGTEPSYAATSKVFVSVKTAESVNELVQGDNFAQNAVQSYSQLVSMPVVLDPVIDELGLDLTARQLAGMVTADTPLDTVIIEIRAVSEEPLLASQISNAVARNLATTVDDIAPQNAAGDSAVSMRIVEPAAAPRFPFAPNTNLLIATGLLAGLALGLVAAVAGQLLDTKVRSSKDVERLTDAAVLGSVAQVRKAANRAITMLSRPRSPQAEAYRKIRANLQFVNAAHELRSLVVTSARAGEGKSTTVVNLALAMAERGSRVLVVDADLRRPTLAGVCGLEGSVGLTTVLIGEATVDDVVQDWGGTGVSVLTAGAAPPNPLQLLESPAMAELLDELTDLYDMVLIDAPPVLPVADAAVLSRLTNGALVVVGAGRTTRQQLRTMLESLGSVGASIVGVVVARAARRDVGVAGYDYAAAPRPARKSRGRRGTAPRSAGGSGGRPSIAATHMRAEASRSAPSR